MFHAIDPADNLFCHNILIGRGRITAVSLARLLDPNLSGMLSPYEAFTSERRKEDAFERMRAAEFGDCPPRLGSIFLFPTLEAADRANQAWWGGKRVMLPATIIQVNRIGQFDGKQLDASEPDWESAARRYWSQANSADPWHEILVEGAVQLARWEPYGRLFGQPRPAPA